MTDDLHDVDLYRTPAEILRRERDHLKARLREERSELKRYADMAEKLDGELAGLIDGVAADVQATEDLLAKYKAAIKKVR